MRLKNSDVQKSNKFLKAVSETYKDFAENTSTHGLQYTVKREVGFYEKIFWILVLICGLCGAIYMTMLHWQRYARSPTRTSIYTAYAPTTSILFPAVTICNLNSIMASKVEEFSKKLECNDTERVIIRRALPQLGSFVDDSFEYNITELAILQDVLEQNDYYNTYPVIQEISQNCSDMLIYCIWNTKKISCLESFSIYFTYSGMCCSFNILKANQYTGLYNPYSGLGTGLRVLINFLSGDTNLSGFRLILHEPMQYPGSLATHRIWKSGKICDIQVIGEKYICSDDVKSLSIDDRKCLYPYEHNLKHFGNKYSVENCLLECEEKVYFEVCGCVPYYFSFSDKPICNLSMITCLQDLRKSHILHEISEKCVCPAQCEYTMYQVISTSSVLKHSGTFSIMSFGNSTIRDEYNVINVFFISKRHTIYLKDTVTSTIYLLSSLGGIYSLFLGCSLITAVEIVYYGFFRFLINLKLFGEVNTDVKYTRKRSIRRRNEFRNNFNTTRIPHIYGNDVYFN